MSVRTVAFVCWHGAAKSVIAAAYLNRLAAERGLSLHATSAGTEPDPEIPPGVLAGLLRDGIDVRGRWPRLVTREALAAAWRVVAFGCDLDGLAPPGTPVIRWDDVPAVSDGFERARDVIAARLPGLLEE